MGVIIGIIKHFVNVAVLGTMVYARALYLELKTTKSKLKNAEETIKALKEELQEQQNN